MTTQVAVFLSTNSLHASLKLVTSSLAISEVKESGCRWHSWISSKYLKTSINGILKNKNNKHQYYVM